MQLRRLTPTRFDANCAEPEFGISTRPPTSVPRLAGDGHREVLQVVKRRPVTLGFPPPHALYLPDFAGGGVGADFTTSAFRSSQREKQPSPSSTCTSDSSACARALHMRAMSVATHIG